MRQLHLNRLILCLLSLVILMTTSACLPSDLAADTAAMETVLETEQYTLLSETAGTAKQETSADIQQTQTASQTDKTTPSSATAKKTTAPVSTKKDSIISLPATEERGIWIYFSELNFKDKSEKSFRAEIDKMFNLVKSKKFNTVYVHVRPFADSFYPSKIFPWSSYVSGEQGKNPGYDPLKYMVEAAHKRGLKFNAWLNPYRISTTSSDIKKLSADNPARKFLSDSNPSNNHWVCAFDNQLYYNPGVAEIQKLIIDGVREIVSGYDVDGIHFDDYFYPTQSASFDSVAYANYKKTSSSPLSLANWRRAQVSAFVSGTYRAIKSIKPSVEFSISPQASFSNNYNQLYADVEKWISSPGYIDKIIPQIYFGFEYPGPEIGGQSFKYDKCAALWSEKTTQPTVELTFGLGLYKSETEQKVGNKISREWLEHTDIMKRQIECSRKLKNHSGVVVFSYSHLTASAHKIKEVENMISVFN